MGVNRQAAGHEVTTSGQPLNRALLMEGSDGLRSFFATLDGLRDEIKEKAAGVDPSMAQRLNALMRKIDRFEASVTLFGQVKAGKTALANVLSGNVDLLPSDVNPWTSVVTSIHMNARNASPKKRAVFKFFDDSEWDAMTKGGGRLGELAGRAGADDDLEKLHRQIEEMRQNARTRLSGKFEALLGKTHKYGYIDSELMERYVCLGDPDELEANPESQQGRFSDLTKTADIWLNVPELGGPLSVRDTPGVNDTFLVREQITIQALRGSKVCVVVLSANEALNTTDLALVRLISNYKERQVVLFVNRIDELARPSEQVPEILGSIRNTLKTYQSLKNVTVVFGSAHWAGMALRGDYSELDEDGVSALEDWMKASGGRASGAKAKGGKDALVWKLAGMPALMEAIGACIVSQSGKKHLEAIRVEIENISSEISVKAALSGSQHAAQKMMAVGVPALRVELSEIAEEASQSLDAVLLKLRDADLMPALRQAKGAYVERAREALLEHLRQKKADDEWSYDASELRQEFRASYDEFAAKTEFAVATVYDLAAQKLTDVYVEKLGVDVAGFKISPPPMPEVPAPIGLGKTIAVDLSGNWWTRWWQRRRGLKTHAEEYAALIDAEVETILTHLEETQVDELFAEIRGVLTQFMKEQTQSIREMVCIAPLIATEASAGRFQKAADDFKSLYDAALGFSSDAGVPETRAGFGGN